MDSSKMDQIRQGLLSLKWGQSPGMTPQETPLEKKDGIKQDKKASDLVHMTKGRAHPRSRRPPKQVSQTSETKSATSVLNDKDHSIEKQREFNLTNKLNGKEKEEHVESSKEEIVVKPTQQPKSASKPALEPSLSTDKDSVKENDRVRKAEAEAEASSDKEEKHEEDSEEAKEKKTLESIKGSVLKNKSRFEQIDTSASKESNTSSKVSEHVTNESSHPVNPSKLDDTMKSNHSSEENINDLSIPKQRAPIETPFAIKASPLASSHSSQNLHGEDKDKDKDVGRNTKILELKKRIASLQKDTAASSDASSSLSKSRYASSSTSLPSTKTPPSGDSTVRRITPQSRLEAVKVIPKSNEDLMGHTIPIKAGDLSSFASVKSANKEQPSPEPVEAKESGKDEATKLLKSRIPELNQFSGPSQACSEALLARWKREKQQAQATGSSTTVQR